MLAFDSPWWIVSAIGLASALRVWMTHVQSVRLPRWTSWALAGVAALIYLWRAHIWLNSPLPPVSPRFMLVILAGIIVAIVYLFDTERAKKHKASIIELIDSALIALLLVFCILRPFVIQAFFIPSASMEHTLEIQDRILVNKFIYFFREPRHGEIIVFRAPPQADPGKKDFIKRVVGLPGDRLCVHSGKLWRNGQPVEEPYLREPPVYTWPVIGRDQFPPQVLDTKNIHLVDDNGMRVLVGEIIVPPGSLVVMGDNRNDSNDSHAWLMPSADGRLIAAPFVPRENVLGKAMLIFWPLWRIRLLS